MTVPPDGRHQFYPNTPRHLNDETAQIPRIRVVPRHAEPTNEIPKINIQRHRYPPQHKQDPTLGSRLLLTMGIITACILILLFSMLYAFGVL